MSGSISNKMKTKINFLIEQINGMGFITRRFFIKFSFDEFLENPKHNINQFVLQERMILQGIGKVEEGECTG